MDLTDLSQYTVLGVLGAGSNGVVLSVAHASGPRFALKLVGHFWDAQARALLDCERLALQQLPPHATVIAVAAAFSAPLPPALHAHLPPDMRAALLRDPAQRLQAFVLQAHPASLDAWRAAWPALPFPAHLLQRAAGDLLRAVRHMRAAHVVHLDLKLDNVLVPQGRGGGGCVVADFGIAAHLPPGRPGVALPLQLAYAEPLPLLVNRAVLAPEVLRALDAAAAAWAQRQPAAALDFAAQGEWAVGLMLWELALGAHPLPDYAASPAYSVSDLPALPEAYPPALAGVLRGLLQPQPALRLSAEAALLALGSSSGSEEAALAAEDVGPPACALTIHLRHWTGHARALRVADAAAAAQLRCADLPGLWPAAEALAAGAAAPAPSAQEVAECRPFLGGLELLRSTHGSVPCVELLQQAQGQGQGQASLLIDLAPPRVQAATITALAHLQRWEEAQAGAEGAALAQSASLRCSLLALTSLASTALSSTSSSDSDSSTSGGGGDDAFPFLSCAGLALRVLAQQGRSSALLAKAAIGLLRNVSCVGEEGLLREMIALGVLQAVCESYFGGLEEGQGALAEDASFAEDCVLCACNMLRMVAAGASSSSSSVTTTATPLPVAELARMAALTGLRAAEAAAAHSGSAGGGGAGAAEEGASGSAAQAAAAEREEALRRACDYSLRLLQCLQSLSHGWLGDVRSGEQQQQQQPLAPSEHLAHAMTQGGSVVAFLATLLHALPLDAQRVEGALTLLCSLLLHPVVRTPEAVPYHAAASALVGALARPEHAGSAGLQGLGAAVLRNLACVRSAVYDSEEGGGGGGGGGGSADALLRSGGALPGTQWVAATLAPPSAPGATALTVAATGAPALLEEAQGRFPEAASLQENARCAMFNLLLLGTAEAEALLHKGARGEAAGAGAGATPAAAGAAAGGGRGEAAALPPAPAVPASPPALSGSAAAPAAEESLTCSPHDVSLFMSPISPLTAHGLAAAAAAAPSPAAAPPSATAAAADAADAAAAPAPAPAALLAQAPEPWPSRGCLRAAVGALAALALLLLALTIAGWRR